MADEAPMPPTRIDVSFEEKGQELKADPETKEIDPNDPAQNPRQGLPETVDLDVPGPGVTQGPITLQQPKPGATGPWIQYNGVATLRIMTEKDWKAAGVESTKYCQWNALNKKRLPREMFTDEELQYLLRVDGRFSLVEE
jgi:hypothetical protein